MLQNTLQRLTIMHADERTDKSVKALLRKVRKESGYASFHTWEPATDLDEANANFPWKPQVGFAEVGGPSGEDVEHRADHWDGGMSDWSDAIARARVGHVIDFYVTKVGDELVTNIEVWFDTATHAYWRDCGGTMQEVTL